MSGAAVTIRPVCLADADALRTIYAYYVDHTAITFEYETPSVDEFAARIQRVTQRYPYLVACIADKPVGYAYAGTFKDRDAYQWACETTIYVAQGFRRAGVGRALYAALERELGHMGILNLYACIGYPTQEDEYLTLDSVRFHERMGYATCGHFARCGYKFERWYDMVWMEKHIGPHAADQQAPTPHPLLPQA